MKTKYNTTPRFYSSALTIATTLAGALSLATVVSASPLDPLDPYQPTAGQYPAMQQSYGLPPQYSGSESIGMRQARFAAGQTSSVYELSSGFEVSVTTEPTTTESQAVRTDVALDEQGMSPVMRSIHQSLKAIAATKGATAAVDSTDISPTFADAGYDTHTMLGVYQQRVQASSNSIESLQARSAQFAGDTQANFSSANQDVTTARAQLDQDFAAARTATPSNWDQVRSSLAVDYKRYSDAVTKAEQIGTGNRSS